MTAPIKSVANSTERPTLYLLHSAARLNDVDEVRELLLKHSKYNDIAQNASNITSIIESALDEFSSNPNERDESGKSLLHNACEGGNISLVQSLIHKYKADVTAVDSQKSAPFHIAAKFGQLEATLLMINKHDCDPNKRGYVGRSLIHYACEGGNLSLVKILIREYKADINDCDDQNSIPLHVAAYSGKADVALCLIDEFGCDPNVKGYIGKSLLHLACQGGNVSLVQTLIRKHKADVTARDDQDSTPLHVAAYSGKADVALCLIDEFCCDPNVKGNIGKSLLHIACQGGNVSLVQTLIRKHKADITARDNQDNTPLHVAAYSGKADVALCLIDEFGCDPNVTGCIGKSLLIQACEGGNVSLVQTLIRKHKADITAHDDQDNTPLHVAAYCGKADVALCLIDEFGYDPNVTAAGCIGKSLLHYACNGGSVCLVKTLIRKHKADVTARDDQDSTPLHDAAYSGKADVALCLIDEFGCDPNVKGNIGKSLLHLACQGGNVSLVQTLIRKHKADITARDNQDNTPLHVAAYSGKADVALCLIDEFGCDPNVTGCIGKSLLIQACEGGNVSLVQTLIRKHKADITAHDDQDNTPLHVAAYCGKADVALCLIDEFGYDPNLTAAGCIGKSLLHYACNGGSVCLVKTLIRKHKADVTARDDQDSTPLHDAAYSGKADVALCLIDEFGCDPNVKGNIGKSLLHLACQGGNVSLVQTLIRKHKADITARDNQDNTPLHVAAYSGKADVALCLIDEFGCDPNVKGYIGKSLLHQACEGGNVSLVQTLIRKHKADIAVRDDQDNTPLHVAAYCGSIKVALSLILEFGCDPTVRGYCCRSLLHTACYKGQSDFIRAFIPYLCPYLVDNDGDTPLHIGAMEGETKCIQALLSANTPLLMRNNGGKTPTDVATRDAKLFLQRYAMDNSEKLQINYDSFLENAKKRYFGENHIIRLFVMGYSGVGKSTLIECLKRESFFKSLQRVSESSVPPHTAGIIPSIYTSKFYGRILLYDFAGDPEYYSSHAAVLENIASSKKGNNIFLIVVDLSSTTVESSLHYWTSFTQQQKFSEMTLSLGVVGSHFDVASKIAILNNSKTIHEFCCNLQSGFSLLSTSCFTIDCRNPWSRGIGDLQKQILSQTKDSQSYRLSEEASVLLGLFEKDFSEVTACPIHIILSHIKESGVCLPDTAKTLHPIISELHDIGVLLLLGDHTKGDYHVVLKSSKLTNEVHEILFSQDAVSKLKNKLKLSQNVSVAGIIPENHLQEILPTYITKECLLSLQYCQEIGHKDVGAFPSIHSSESTDQSFLFFPALCYLDNSEIAWDLPADLSFNYSIGWLARCTDCRDYFPPRFLHVLLLRLVFRFTESVSAEVQSPAVSPDHQRYCTMWKTGVQWSMEEGVKCRVELVNGNKEVVVLIKSIQDNTQNCATIFSQIVSCVMVAKAEFCHSIKPKFFLLDSTCGEDYLSDDNLFPMSDVQRILTSFESKKVVYSISRDAHMDCSKLLLLRKLSLWDSLFPMKFLSVVLLLQDVVEDLPSLGLHLGVPSGIVNAIEADLPLTTRRRREELVKAWMESSLDPPCWWRLVQALKRIDHIVLATKIEKENSKF